MKRELGGSATVVVREGREERSRTVYVSRVASKVLGNWRSSCQHGQELNRKTTQISHTRIPDGIAPEGRVVCSQIHPLPATALRRGSQRVAQVGGLLPGVEPVAAEEELVKETMVAAAVGV